MAPTILHVEAIQDHQARVRPPHLLIVVSLTTAPDLVQNVARPENTKEWLEITRLKPSGVLNRRHPFLPGRITP